MVSPLLHFTHYTLQPIWVPSSISSIPFIFEVHHQLPLKDFSLTLLSDNGSFQFTQLKLSLTAIHVTTQDIKEYDIMPYSSTIKWVYFQIIEKTEVTRTKHKGNKYILPASSSQTPYIVFFLCCACPGYLLSVDFILPVGEKLSERRITSYIYLTNSCSMLLFSWYGHILEASLSGALRKLDL